MKTIAKDTVLVEAVTQGSHVWDYTVVKGSHLLLVLSVAAEQDVSITPSIHLSGRGTSATVIGLVTGTKTAKIDIRTLQHHASPDTTSNLLIKSVLYDTSACLYQGSITVDTEAQKTDAYQRNENLLMEEGTRAVSSPALEILANDVRCTHGAVVKTIDREELWYLASRGIDRKTARSMIASGFLLSALDRISDPETRTRIEETLRIGRKE